MNPFYTSHTHKRNTPTISNQQKRIRTHANTSHSRTNKRIKTPSRHTNLSGLRCVSHNINGINKPDKRDDIINKYIIDKLDIICLIHTRLPQSKQKQLENKYKRKYDIVLNSNPQRGILLMITNTKDIQWKEVHRKDDGNLITIEFKFDNKTFITHFAYAPSTDDTTRIEFFKHLEHKVNETNNDFFIITGDLNVILNNKNKINYLTTPHLNTVNHVKNFIDKKGLTDISIHKNMHTPHITWTTLKLNDSKTQRPQNSTTLKLDDPESQRPQILTTPNFNDPKT